MSDQAVLGICCMTLVLAIISLAFQLYVGRQLRNHGQEVGIALGKNSWAKPFVLGWQHAAELEIYDVMIAWSIVLALAFIGMFSLVFSLV